MGKSKLALGLDIGSSSVKLVQLKEKKGGYTLAGFGTAPLPPEAIVDGALMNSGAIVEAIQGLLSEQRIKAKDVAIGVRGHSVIIKKIQMPRMTQEELDESIQWEAEQYIPFDVKDVNISTQILTPDGDAAGQMDVLLVAAKKDLINDYTAVCAEAGLNVSVVGVDALAVQKAFEVNYDLPGETAVLINVGAAVSNINVVANGQTTFTRDVTMGGNAFTEEIQKQLNVSYEEAEALKIGGHGESDSVVPQEVERVIQGVAEQLAGEIQRSLDFYSATAADHRLSRVYLSGGTARVPALAHAIEQRAGVPVDVLDPFKSIDVDHKKFDPALIANAAAGAAVAVGLALRSQGDAYINLLPVRTSKKKQAGLQQLVAGVAVLGIALAGNFLWTSFRAGAVGEAEAKIKRTKAEIVQLEKIIGEVNDIKQQQAAVKQKLDVLDRLKAGRTGPVRMMDELATLTPKRVWLRKMEENGGQMTFTGTAGTIEDVSAFMGALKRSPFFTEVELKKTTAKAEGRFKVAEFVVTAKVNYAPGVQVAAASKPAPAR